jgi:hypothetical protein
MGWIENHVNINVKSIFKDTYITFNLASAHITAFPNVIYT